MRIDAEVEHDTTEPRQEALSASDPRLVHILHCVSKTSQYVWSGTLSGLLRQ